MVREPLELVRGTLDLLILKTLSLESRHGYDIARWIDRKTGSEIRVDEGALYQALRRLEEGGWLESEWRVSSLGREAKFYDLTRKGRLRLKNQAGAWGRYARAMAAVLKASEA